jgi:nucleotide-binding universal stress UspA family protein
MNNKPIVVAVSGEERAALEYAVAEALRTGSQLRLLHVVEPMVMAGTPVGPVISYHDLDETAWQIVDRAKDIVDSIAGDSVEVERVVRRGSAAHDLVEESRTCRLVVLEHRELSRLTRVFTGSTSTAVAARAHCPVVSVPQGWEPGSERRVVVGVDEAGEPEQALRVAFDEAARRQARLSVRHAWRLAEPYDDLGVRTGVEADWRRQTRPVLDEAVQRWASKTPDVSCDVDLLYDRPATALVKAAENADLLVLGRRTRRGPLRIGSIARAMIRIATCPVMVVPLPDRPEAETDDWELTPEEVSPEA